MTAARTDTRHSQGQPLQDITGALSTPFLAGATLSIHRDLAACEPWWRAAEISCACYAFQCFDWQAAWMATIGAAGKVSPHVVRIADAQNRTLLILPLGIGHEKGLRVLRLLGHLVSDYNAPLIDEALARALAVADVERLWAGILAQLPPVDLVWLWRMPQVITRARR